MKPFDEILEQAFRDADLQAADVPRIDLYMDQILTLVDEGLARNKRLPDDKLLTKTMVNNYSKERLIMPVRGKKYSRGQVMQLLCILTLKQQLALSDIKKLVSCGQDEIDFEHAYTQALLMKERLRGRLPELLRELVQPDGEMPGARETLLAAAFQRTLSGVLDRCVFLNVLSVNMPAHEEQTRKRRPSRRRKRRP